MSFALFITYIVCTYLRPFDTIASGLASYRPMLILWAVAFLAAGTRAWSRHEVAARPAHFWLLGLLVASIALSQLANQWAGGALPAIADFSTAGMLMVLCMLNLTSLRRLQVTCVAIASCIIILAGIGTYSFHSGFMAEELVLRQNPGEESEAGVVPDASDDVAPADDVSGRYFLRLRSFGFLNDPNDFAQAMVMVLPILWWFYIPGRSIRNFFLVGAPGALMGYAIYLTQSRGALLGVAALGLLIMQRVLGLFRTALIVAVVAAAVGLVSFGGRELSVKEESAAQRIEAWQEGLTMLRSKPILGVGYGRFTEHHYLTAHNSFVLCFAELGLVGYFAWLGLIVLTFKGLLQAIQLAEPNSPEKQLAEVLKASLTAFLVCSWFLSRTYSPGLFVVLALGVASRFGMQWAEARSAGSSANTLPPWIKSTLVSMVVSIIAVYSFILVQRGSN